MLLIGVSDEDEKLIEDTFINKLGAKYPFIKVKNVNTLYAIQFFPSIYTVDPDGTIITVPNDRMPSENLIEQQLANVSLAPKMPEDPRYDAIRQHWEKKEYKRLSDYLEKMLSQEKLDAEMRPVLEAQKAELEKRSTKQVERVASLAQGPDFAEAQDKLDRIEKDWKGLPPADAAHKELDRFAKDPAIKKELAAGKVLQHVMSSFDPNRISQRKKLIEELEKFAKRFEGTAAAKRANETRMELAKRN